jgi:LysM repeat protein
MKLNNLKSTTIYTGMQLKIPSASGGTTGGTTSGGNTSTGGSSTGSGNTGNSSPSVSYTRYTVKRGDTLWNIAKSRLGSGSRYTEIMKLNGLKSDAIYPGQVLKLPK